MSKKKKNFPKLSGLKPIEVYSKGIHDGEVNGITKGMKFAEVMWTANIYNCIDELSEDEERQKEIAKTLDKGYEELLVKLSEDTQFVEYLKLKMPEIREKLDLPKKDYK